MQQNTFGLNGTWVQAEPDTYPYTIKIDDNRIIIEWNNKILCNTIFEFDGMELKNTQKRRNWQDYVEGHQHEHFGHFESIKYENNSLVAIMFEADFGNVYIPFIRP